LRAPIERGRRPGVGAPDGASAPGDGHTSSREMVTWSNIKGLDNAVGDVGGFAILTVKDSGRDAAVSSFVVLPLAAGASVVDPHGLRGAAFEAAWRDLGITPAQRISLPSWEAVKLTVAQGGGVTGISRYAVVPELAAGT